MSFLILGIIYRFDLSVLKLELKVLCEIGFEIFVWLRFEIKQVFVISKDGVKVFMFIVFEKDFV